MKYIDSFTSSKQKEDRYGFKDGISLCSNTQIRCAFQSISIGENKWCT